MIKKYLTADRAYYLSVFFILLLAVLALIYFTGNIRLQGIIVIGISFIYAFWGIIHHFIHHDLTLKIVVEYVLIGTVGMSAMLFLLKGL
ncbi:hypothetical protein M1615_01210 [Patescibacteria group bacterium]|nr:hypothetical protein [Patescibacteria group bacterium]MCL5010159.1 hypothetical protein [Patescibacteria group bacterium]